MEKISLRRLREVLAYDPNTGEFTWLERLGCRTPIGGRAGSLNQGYIKIKIEGRLYQSHHLAWLLMFGEWPEEIDHANGDGADNRISNLRLATRAQNTANRGIFKNNTSGFKGVTWDKRKHKWQAQLEHAGKKHHLGRFDTPEEAHAAYSATASRVFGEFARAA